MTSDTTTAISTQVYRVYIKATPEAIWDAITKPEWTQKYGYRCPMHYDLRPGGAYRAIANQEMRDHGAPETVVDGEVVEVDPPHRLVQTYRFVWDAELESEGFTTVTWEIQPDREGITMLTVTHELEGKPKHAELASGDVPNAGGGWPWILSDLKSILESGHSLTD